MIWDVLQIAGWVLVGVLVFIGWFFYRMGKDKDLK